MPRIAVIAGDGIGPEVITEGVRLLRALDQALGLDMTLTEMDYGAERFLRDGTTMPESQIAEFRSGAFDAILFGAVGDPRVPDNQHAEAILLTLRRRLDLYQNIRPVKLLADDLTPLKGKTAKDIDFVVMRENTEGAYAAIGGALKRGTPDEVAINEDVNTRKGVERIVRAALDLARRTGKTSVAMSDKANVMRAVGDLWQRCWREVGEEFPGIERRHIYVDALCMDLVRRPETYQVVVTSNMFGDIVTDLGAAIAGGLGLAASANVGGSRPGLFEPVHGSAPDIAGQGKANPMAAALTVGLMLEHLGRPELSDLVEQAVSDVLRDGKRTPDVGGTDSTSVVGAALAARAAALAKA